MTETEWSRFKRLEAQKETFKGNFFSILSESRVKTQNDLNVARKINLAAGQDLSDESEVRSLVLTDREVNSVTLRGENRKFMFYYNLVIRALGRGSSQSGSFQTVGEIRNSDVNTLATVRYLGTSGALFAKAIFAPPQQSE